MRYNSQNDRIGEKEHRGRISHSGNKRIRTAIVLSAWMAVRNNPEMTNYYETYRSEGKPANKAIIKIARKLALSMKAVIRDKRKYKPKT